MPNARVVDRLEGLFKQVLMRVNANPLPEDIVWADKPPGAKDPGLIDTVKNRMSGSTN